MTENIIMKKLPLLYFFFLVSIISTVSLSQSRAAGNDTILIPKGLSNQQYISYAIEETDKQRYNHCLAACNEVFKSEPNNAAALQIAAKIYTIENKWDEAISYGERAVAASPSSTEAYNNLYRAYEGKGDWTNGVRVLNQLLVAHPDSKLAKDEMPIASQHVQVGGYSNVLVWLFVILVIAYFIVRYIQSTSNSKLTPPAPKIGMVEMFFIAASISYIFYLLFFLFSPQIWSTNLKMAPEDICPHILNFTFQHDGKYMFYLQVSRPLFCSLQFWL